MTLYAKKLTQFIKLTSTKEQQARINQAKQRIKAALNAPSLFDYPLGYKKCECCNGTGKTKIGKTQ